MNLSVKIPAWFWIVAILLLVWNAMGVGAFFDVFNKSSDPEALAQLPENEIEMFNRSSSWIMFTFGAAVISGFLACVALVMKRAWAVPLFVLSLITVILHDIGIFGVVKAQELMGNGAFFMPALVLVICIFQVWFSRKAKSNTWLS